MLKGKALTTAFLTMLNSRLSSISDEHSFGTGKLTSVYDTSLLLPVLSLEEVRSVRAGVQSAKVPANVVLAPTTEAYDLTFDPRNLVFSLADADPTLLHAQFVDESAVDALRNNDVRSFLNRRANLISESASELVGYDPNH